jgi:ribonuclease HII
VLLDYEALRDHRVRPLALLNDSKQVSADRREELFRAVLSCATKVSVRVIPHSQIDRNGLHRSNLAGLRAVLADLAPPAEACLVDGFRLGPAAPPHTAVVDGDERSAAIAAASIVAKVSRDRAMRRLDALFPHYGFSSHVGYITPSHSAVVRERGPCAIHRRSFQALCYLSEEELAAREALIDAAEPVDAAG